MLYLVDFKKNNKKEVNWIKYLKLNILKSVNFLTCKFLIMVYTAVSVFTVFNTPVYSLPTGGQVAAGQVVIQQGIDITTVFPPTPVPVPPPTPAPTIAPTVANVFPTNYVNANDNFLALQDVYDEALFIAIMNGYYPYLELPKAGQGCSAVGPNLLICNPASMVEFKQVTKLGPNELSFH